MGRPRGCIDREIATKDRDAPAPHRGTYGSHPVRWRRPAVAARGDAAARASGRADKRADGAHRASRLQECFVEQRVGDVAAAQALCSRTRVRYDSATISGRLASRSVRAPSISSKASSSRPRSREPCRAAPSTAATAALRFGEMIEAQVRRALEQRLRLVEIALEEFEHAALRIDRGQVRREAVPLAERVIVVETPPHVREAP